MRRIIVFFVQKRISFFFALCLTISVNAQELLPFVANYSKTNFEGDNQIWNVVQGNDKAMYFANNHYLLRFDGVKWEKYNLPNKTIIRSVFVEGDKIFSGSYKEFGYWYRIGAKMKYVSISDKNNVFNEKDSDEIWKIFKFKNIIYFQSFNSMFIYDGKKIERRKFPFLISYAFVIQNEIVLGSVQNGVYRMTASTFEKIPGLSILENNIIHSIEKQGNTIYFFTKKNGVFVLENGILSPWNTPLNTILKTANINVARFIENNKLIIGTANNGVYIYDMVAKAYQNMNRNNVLMNNSVLSITEDSEANLWLGLDNGLAHIEVASPISIFYDKSGVLGSVYSVVTTPNGYLMASNHGIFEYKNQRLQLLNNSQGQAWNITKTDKNFIIGHNEGTFVYQNELVKGNSVSGGWNLNKSAIDEIYMQATYSGVSLYKNLDHLDQRILVNGLWSPIKYVAQNRKNEIWAADNYRGLYRIMLNNDFRTLKVENITQKNHFKNDFGVKIFEFRNEILFLIDRTWFTFNSLTNKLESNSLFNANFKDVSDIVGIDDSQFLVFQNGLLYHVAAQENQFVKNNIQEKYYKGKLINDNLKIFKDKNTYLLNLDDGFIALELKPKVKEQSNLKIEAFTNGNLIPNDAIIPYNSELRLYLISGKYGFSRPYLYYKTDESNEFIPINDGLLVLNNLNSGYHEISIYSTNGSNYKLLKIVDFKVAKPWYFSFWMVFLYALILGIIAWFYYKWNALRYQQKLALREEELKHQKMILELELITENELNKQEYEKHILELEVQAKSSEVAGKSLSIAKQSEMIDKIQSILETENDTNRLKSEIKKAIKINAVNKHEWETFESNINQIHKEFITKLAVLYPNLTPKDIKLCTYLKMNMSSKEIAPLLNISFRGVELHRYRLRKKLGIEQEVNLTKFLLSL